MTQKLKAKKCRDPKCRKEFVPNTLWQKFCSIRCRARITYRRNHAWVKRARAKLEKIEQERMQQQQETVAQ